MQMSPIIAVHLTAALAALALGPVALWARLGQHVRPWLHRGAGYAWVTFMLSAAISAVFIRDFQLPNLAGYTPIHLFVPITLAGLGQALYALTRRDLHTHRHAMVRVYLGACVAAGVFTLLPSRYLGDLLWRQWLGWL